MKAVACDAPYQGWIRIWRAGSPAKSSRTLGRPALGRLPILVRPVEANAAKLELALHASQLRVGDRLDHVFQIAVDAPQSGACAETNALSRRPAEPISARTMAGAGG